MLTAVVNGTQAGDSIRADPRCVVSRGVELTIESPAALERSLLRELKRNLLASKERRDPLQIISNADSTKATDCVLAPVFPGEMAVVSITSDNSDNAPANKRLTTMRVDRSEGSNKRSSRSRTGSGRERARVRKKTGGPNTHMTENLVLMSQALVAVGSDVTVAPLNVGGEQLGATNRRLNSDASSSKMVHLSRCNGNGQVAIAGCGRLIRVHLQRGQKRALDLSKVVAWTDEVKWTSTGERRSGTNGLGAVITFEGPGIVFIQTHSVAGLRRLLAPLYGAAQNGNMLTIGHGWAGKLRMKRRGDVGISLKRGIAKRTKAGVRKIILTAAFFTLYVAVYSVITTLLLEGRDGLVNAPKHAVQVIRSLAKVARRVVLVLIRLGKEELWTEACGDQATSGDVVPIPAQAVPER